MRRNLFIALPLPEEAQKELLELRGFFLERKFSANPHITLYFIGSGHAHENYADALEKVRERAFELELSRLGTFGDRTLWAGLRPC